MKCSANILYFFAIVMIKNVTCIIYPRASPTRHQFVAGLGVPLDLPSISVLTGYVLRGQYFLPYNVSQLVPTFARNDTQLEEVDSEIIRRRSMKRSIEKEDNGNSLEWNDWTEPFGNLVDQTMNYRWIFYDIIMAAIEKYSIYSK